MQTADFARRLQGRLPYEILKADRATQIAHAERQLARAKIWFWVVLAVAVIVIGMNVGYFLAGEQGGWRLLLQALVWVFVVPVFHERRTSARDLLAELQEQGGGDGETTART